MSKCGMVIEYGCGSGDTLLVPSKFLYEATEMIRSEGKSFSCRRAYTDEYIKIDNPTLFTPHE